MPPDQNPQNLSEQQLRFGYWFVIHKLLLRKLLIVFLIVVDAALVGFALYGFIDYAFISGPRERAALAGLARGGLDFHALVVRNAPRPLEVTSVVLVPGKAMTDAVGRVRNSNREWYAIFDYQFLVSGEATVPRRGFVLPGEEKYIFDLAIAVKGAPRNARLELRNISWQRVNPHTTPDPAAFLAERLGLDIKDVNYTASLKIDGGEISRVTFAVENHTAYGFWQAAFNVVLIRGNAIAGANRVVAEGLRSLERRELAATWFEPVGAVSKVEIQPDINIFDPSVYLPAGR